MQIILLIPVETRLGHKQTEKPNQVCKRRVKIYLHGLCVGPTQTLRYLKQQFAFRPEVLAPEEKSSCTTATELLSGNRIITNSRSFSSLPCSPPQQGWVFWIWTLRQLCLMIQLESRVMIQGQLTQVTWEKKECSKRKVLLCDLQLFLISTVYHPSLNKIPVLFLLIHPCKHLTSLKPAQLQNSCQTSNPPPFFFTNTGSVSQRDHFVPHVLPGVIS